MFIDSFVWEKSSVYVVTPPHFSTRPLRSLNSTPTPVLSHTNFFATTTTTTTPSSAEAQFYSRTRTQLYWKIVVDKKKFLYLCVRVTFEDIVRQHQKHQNQNQNGISKTGTVGPGRSPPRSRRRPVAVAVGRSAQHDGGRFRRDGLLYADAGGFWRRRFAVEEGNF